jgi:hypothetical protein
MMGMLCGLNNHVDVNTLQVSPNSSSPIEQECSNNPSFATIQYRSDGEERTNFNGCTQHGHPSATRGNWLEVGDSADVWVERIMVVGTFNWSDPGAGRHNLSTTRTFTISAFGFGSTNNATATFKFWDAASGGNLLAEVTIALMCASDIT